jgi:hypothetical protein
MSYNSVVSPYEKVWDDYLSELAMKPNLHLTRFLRSRHIGVHGFEMWMNRRGYSVRQAKAHAASLQPSSSKEESVIMPEASFVPVVLQGESCPESRSNDVLTGISITLPDGTVITIRRGSAKAVVSFLKLYSGEGKPCSD